jgi:hypothetical protein
VHVLLESVSQLPMPMHRAQLQFEHRRTIHDTGRSIWVSSVGRVSFIHAQVQPGRAWGCETLWGRTCRGRRLTSAAKASWSQFSAPSPAGLFQTRLRSRSNTARLHCTGICANRPGVCSHRPVRVNHFP